MRQIGPFAQTKAEGEPAGKWDGVLDFQCVNPDCENYNKIIRKETLG
ncbi:MAG: hypothetical protein WC531_00895 [Candidatus Paceibacterota bacterium]